MTSWKTGLRQGPAFIPPFSTHLYVRVFSGYDSDRMKEQEDSFTLRLSYSL
jgi:hypothetical protein